jgi:bifunctional non-homologous end joining protein LigD
VVEITNADRVVFPEVGITKGDVVHYYQRIAPRLLPYVIGRPLSIKRYPKGVAAPGFFQKNVPPHYPASIRRFSVPRAKGTGKKASASEVTIYPIVEDAEHLAYLGNQGAIELHVPTSRADDLLRPDRLIIDLDPPAGATDLVRRAAHLTREALAKLGLETTPVATGSKGYHLVAPIVPEVGVGTIASTLQKVAALLATRHPDELTTVFRIAGRGLRVFVDWLRNNPIATAVVPYSIRARPRASVATPLEWSEVDTVAPDAFTIRDIDALLDRPDPLDEMARSPQRVEPFIAAVDEAFASSGLTLETFDRFRS